MAERGLLTRDEVLGGLPAKRASALLFLIESRAARAVARARHAVALFDTDEAARERELAFVEAFALGREPPGRLTIQDLERHTAAWADLVPDNPRLRAALARLLAQKYPFAASEAPRIRAALGLERAAVEAAYERLYGAPLSALYLSREGWRARARWARARIADRLESLPPFWTVFTLTLTETVGQGVLALPIAVAGIGPLPGIALLVLLGLVNVITIAALAEAVTRTASVRYGEVFFRRIVYEYLGNAGAVLLTWALLVVCAVALVGYHIGLATTMDDATGVSAAVWMALLFALDLYFLTRKSLNSTVASSLAVGAINLSLIAILAVLAFTRLHVANVSHVSLPWLSGQPFDRSLLGLVFGVILAAYFGHTSLGSCAKVVIRRDPGGRSLVWGAVAGIFTAVVIYSIWVLAVNGAIPRADLLHQQTTVIPPLARGVGSSVYVFGSVFVLLGMGMGSIQFSLVLFNTMRDWLPRRSHPVVLLPRRGARLLFQPRGTPTGRPALALTYRGLAVGQARFALEQQDGWRTYRAEATVTARWQARDALPEFPGFDGHGLDLTLDVLAADEDQVRFRVVTPLSVTYDGAWEPPGLALAAVLADDESDWPFLRWMMRRQSVSAAEVAAQTGEGIAAAAARLEALEARGVVRVITGNGDPRYQIRLSARRWRRLSDEMWQSLGQAPEARATRHGVGRPDLRRWLGAMLLGERGRFLVGALPAAVIFLLAEWLTLTHRTSFTAVLSYCGLIAVSVFAGIFSTLLLMSSRRRGDLMPGTTYRFLGNPVLLAAIYALFLGSIFLHGLVIWRGPVERGGALVMGCLVLVMTVVSARHGAFARRIVVTFREDPAPNGLLAFEVVAGGRPHAADVHLDYATAEQHLRSSAGEVASRALRSARFAIAANGARDLKVWALRQLPDGEVEGRPGTVRIVSGPVTECVDPRLSDGQTELPLAAGVPTVEIVLDGSEPA